MTPGVIAPATCRHPRTLSHLQAHALIPSILLARNLPTQQDAAHLDGGLVALKLRDVEVLDEVCCQRSHSRFKCLRRALLVVCARALPCMPLMQHITRGCARVTSRRRQARDARSGAQVNTYRHGRLRPRTSERTWGGRRAAPGRVSMLYMDGRHGCAGERATRIERAR
jgi:hypothetical protein